MPAISVHDPGRRLAATAPSGGFPLSWKIFDIPSQRERVAVVTGTGGLGYETGLALSRAGAEVILAGRSQVKGAAAVARIRAAAPDSRITFELVDLASLSSVEAFAERLLKRGESLDLLINNAGVMGLSVRQTTTDGFELQFGTNYLGHFALVAHLLPVLKKAAAPRVVNVSSQAYRRGRIDFEDLQGARRYDPFRAYSQSKLAQVVFALELQRRSDSAGWNLISNLAHPGWATTDLFVNGPGDKSVAGWLNKYVAGPLFAQSAADGALSTLYAATSPNAVGAALYGPSGFGEMRGPPKRTEIVPSAAQPELAARLWKISEELIRARIG